MWGVRRFGVVAVAAALAVTAGCSAGDMRARDAGPDPTPPSPSAPRAEAPLPRSMAALGDSMTRAFLLCRTVDCPLASWATGEGDVGSHRQRIERRRGGPVEVHNVAINGGTVRSLERQAAAAVAARVEYATVLIGANDACAPDESGMTAVADFAASFDRALATLVRGLPRARILVVSIPDLLRLWEVGKDSAEVRSVWRRFGICQSMLADPTSTSAEATARRTRVRDRVVAYNDAMAAACARHRTCRWDGNAVFDVRFSLDMVSSRDYWHPSRLGQQTLAEVSWQAGFWS